ncbi:hypothetical protein LSH36_313g02018 [Paralvinella palmiformis]|uniref:Uncharacterized protein n=1 Tax=Paralvinella palmiformis TaxID=53620 RepID=A0AAD9N3J2_9ANNE|nr:hypothetical protein LSH36_313g02018 [Paralvinella palmiformis]
MNYIEIANRFEDFYLLPVSQVTSKWEIDTSDAQLDKLDGLRHGKMSIQHARMEDYLQLPDDYDTRMSEPGKKRVRWADIEERKSQARMRDIGFVLGQTNWDKMVDDTYADRALNQTKYI